MVESTGGRRVSYNTLVSMLIEVMDTDAFMKAVESHIAAKHSSKEKKQA